MNIKEIQKLALKNGAGEWAVKKWATRKRIPLEWQIKIMKAEPGLITFSDFDAIHRDMKKIERVNGK